MNMDEMIPLRFGLKVIKFLAEMKLRGFARYPRPYRPYSDMDILYICRVIFNREKEKCDSGCPVYNEHPVERINQTEIFREIEKASIVIRYKYSYRQYILLSNFSITNLYCPEKQLHPYRYIYLPCRIIYT